MDYFIRIFFSGLTKGSIYALLTLGYTMVYGIVKLINFAHGEIYMIGAFSALISYALLSPYDLPMGLLICLCALTSIIVSSAYAYFINDIAYKPLRTSPRLSALISAVGLSIFLRNYILLVQTPRYVPFPPLLPYTLLANGLINSQQLIIFITVMVFMILFSFMIKYSKLGRAMRAASQDLTMARLLGVNVNFVIAMAFVIGGAAAALGGFMIGSYTGQINFNIGYLVGIKAFVAAVLGGIGSIPGAVVGSFILGMIESYGAGYVSSNYEDIFAFFFLIVLLIFRPAGIFGNKEKEKV